MTNRTAKFDAEKIIPSVDENAHLEQLSGEYLKVSEMSEEDRCFLNSLILRNKPKKILEIGISAGASSVVILNAIRDLGNAVCFIIQLISQPIGTKTMI